MAQEKLHWYFKRSEQGTEFEGPVSGAQLSALAAKGILTLESLVLSESSTKNQWVSAARIPKLRELMEANQARPVATPPPIRAVSKSKSKLFPVLIGVAAAAIVAVAFTGFLVVRFWDKPAVQQANSKVNETKPASQPKATQANGSSPVTQQQAPVEQRAPEPPKEPPKRLVDFSLAGMRIGDELTREMEYKHVASKDVGNFEVMASQTIEVGDIELFVIYTFLDRRLESVSLLFKPKDFEEVLSTFVAKFGKPDNVENEVVTNALKTEFLNMTCTWRTNQGEFVLQKYAGKVTDSYGSLRSERYEKYIEAKKNEEMQQLQKKL